MKTIALFGASGGLGKQLLPLLQTKYNVIGLSSSDINVTNFNHVNEFFETNNIDTRGKMKTDFKHIKTT